MIQKPIGRLENIAKRALNHQRRCNFSNFYEKEFVQEHDYTVTPSTYIYTTEENKEQFERFPLIDASATVRRTERPKKARMLGREFIDDSMYNPHYGYFSKSAEIFSLKDKFEVDKMGNIDSFIDQWSIEYKKQQNDMRAHVPEKPNDKVPNDEKKNLKKTRVSRHLWHTPSELFTPYYGKALARHILDQYDQNGKSKDLIIYETGAGNGTLMVDILNFLKAEHPDLYSKTTYNIVEISASLALKQRAQSEGHTERVQVHNCSIFDWKQVQEQPCFFIALEVWDNLAHDVIRYDNTSQQPYQGYIVIDLNGDFTEVYNPRLDKLAVEFLEARSQINFKPNASLGWHPLSQPMFYRNIKNAMLPFHGNLSSAEFIPTRLFQLFKKLKTHFPQHKLLAADFTHFPGRIDGYSSPVVQTFMDDSPVTVSTYMVLQGFFDIMFPTDFKLAQQLYAHVIGRPATIAQHGEFLKKWANLKESATITGENPMLSFYRNAAFLYS